MKLKTKFQDEDFELGEVAEVTVMYTSGDKIIVAAIASKGGVHSYSYDSIKKMCEEWEDYEEPKDYYFIRSESLTIGYSPISNTRSCRNRKQIGNYFETKEEADKAVEKLKAITRLNKCGFRFEGYTDRDRANGGDIVIYAHVDIPNNNLLEEAQPAMLADLNLLFKEEE